MFAGGGRPLLPPSGDVFNCPMATNGEGDVVEGDEHEQYRGEGALFAVETDLHYAACFNRSNC
jgi:hypothetical protein